MSSSINSLLDDFDAMPGGPLATRPLHFFWVLDASGSMSVDGKIQSLNAAIQEAIPAMRDAASENPTASLLVRALTFATGAHWHISVPTPVEQFVWQPVTTGQVTDMGKAFLMLAEQLKIPPMTDRALPPVIVLMSDGQPTDDYQGGLRTLMSLPWAKKAVRLAIAIGKDADTDVLAEFIGNSELPVLRADNPEALVAYIKWASTAVVKAASAPASDTRVGRTPPAGNVPVPAPPVLPVNADDVW